MTRAKEQLFLSYANKRRVFGKTLTRTVSPFVARIEQRLLNYESQPFKKKAKEDSRQRQLFD
jgi:superfamily I DNA/RNA helicase